jgi:hypothetical protein
MKALFQVHGLSRSEADQAFPLIQAIWPGTDLDSWRDFVTFFGGQNTTGTLVIRDAADSICGILAYRIDWTLHVGRILAVHLFIAADLMNSSRPVRALLDAAEKRASGLNCAGVHIHLDKDQMHLGSRLRRLGLTLKGNLFSKMIDRPRDAV